MKDSIYPGKVQIVNLESALSFMFNPFRRLTAERIVFRSNSIEVYTKDDEDLHTVIFEPKIGVANIQDVGFNWPIKDLDIEITFNEDGLMTKALWVKAYF